MANEFVKQSRAAQGMAIMLILGLSIGWLLTFLYHQEAMGRIAREAKPYDRMVRVGVMYKDAVSMEINLQVRFQGAQHATSETLQNIRWVTRNMAVQYMCQERMTLSHKLMTIRGAHFGVEFVGMPDPAQICPLKISQKNGE